MAHREYSSFLSCMGRHEEGLEEARLAQRLDLLSVNASHELGYQLLTGGALQDAATEFRKAIDLNPTWIWGNIKLGMAYGLVGEAGKATACVHRADELLDGASGSPLTQSWLATIELLAGESTRMRETLARLQSESRQTYVNPIAVAWLHYGLGDDDGVFAEVERGYALRAPTMVFLAQVRPFHGRGPGPIRALARCSNEWGSRSTPDELNP